MRNRTTPNIFLLLILLAISTIFISYFLTPPANSAGATGSAGRTCIVAGQTSENMYIAIRMTDCRGLDRIKIHSVLPTHYYMSGTKVGVDMIVLVVIYEEGSFNISANNHTANELADYLRRNYQEIMATKISQNTLIYTIFKN